MAPLSRWQRALGVAACAILCASCGAKASQTSRPSRASVPPRIETWAYVDSCHGVGPGQTSLVRHWVTYAEDKCANPHPFAPSACHEGSTSYCTAVSYIDPNLDWSRAGLGMVVPSCIRPAGSSTCANESWFVHESSAASRLTWTNSVLGHAYLLNGADPALESFVTGYTHRVLSDFNGLMVDDIGASALEQFFGDGTPIYTSSAELPTDAAVQEAHFRLAEKLAPSFLQIDNGLNVNPNSLPAFVLLNHPSAVVGLVSESYPENSATNTLSSWYSTGLDDMAYLDNTPSLSRNFLVLLGYNTIGSLVARRVQEATVMLGFKPGKIVDWADLATWTQGLAIWPEEGLYFEQPIQTMQTPSGPRCMNGLGGPCAHGHMDLQVAGGANAHEQSGGAGVYRREFRRCFLGGVPIGGCAAVMNDTDRPVTISSSWLTQRYGFEMTMEGGEVQRGGRLTVEGTMFSPDVTTLGADDAALLSQ
ncbi:MAG: hypothetical protein ACLP01_00765 [Solirubrobacteraceae bacterium]